MPLLATPEIRSTKFFHREEPETTRELKLEQASGMYTLTHLVYAVPVARLDLVRWRFKLLGRILRSSKLRLISRGAVVRADCSSTMGSLGSMREGEDPVNGAAAKLSRNSSNACQSIELNPV